MSDASRYKGKHLLRILECYVLQKIGHLSELERSTMEQMTPKLAQTYKRSGTWDQIVSAEMKFPADLPVKLKELWDRNCQIAREQGLTLTPIQFAQGVVDQSLTS